MYIPQNNLLSDKQETIAFMQRYNFATIVSYNGNIPVATHLPFIISQQNDALLLISHFAKANNHWKLIEKNTSLVIFNEPHAYISPTHYDNKLNVPTWNYIAVHAYGIGELITSPQAVTTILEQTIHSFEADYIHQWNQLPQDYKTKMAKGIVAFQIHITDLQGKKKLSQNKTTQEQQRIINTLNSSNDTTARDIGLYMEKNIIAKHT